MTEFETEGQSFTMSAWFQPYKRLPRKLKKKLKKKRGFGNYTDPIKEYKVTTVWSETPQ